MKALILAAGKGTRLMPLSLDIPKPMLPILDRPVLECLIEHLAQHGVDQIIINTSYLAKEIEDYFRSGRRFGVDLAFTYEGIEMEGKFISTPLGSAGTLRAIQNHTGFFDDTFLVLCGDALIDIDITALVDAHHQSGALATLALAQTPPHKLSQYGVAVLDNNRRITSFQEKPAPEVALSNLANTGVYVFEPEIFDYIPASTPADLGGDVFPALAREGKAIYGAEIPFNWIDIGRVADYFAVQMRAIQGEFPNILPLGKQLQNGLYVGANCRIDPRHCHIEGPVILADSVTIENHATLIGPLWIGRGSVIERGAHLERSVVFNYTRVGSQAVLIEKLASGRWCANADAITIDPLISNIPWILSDSRTPRPHISASERRFFEEVDRKIAASVSDSPLESAAR